MTFAILAALFGLSLVLFYHALGYWAWVVPGAIALVWWALTETFLHRPVQEGALPLGQFLDFEIEELAPVGIAGEEFAVPPNGPGFEGDPLRLTHARHEGRDEPHHP